MTDMKTSLPLTRHNPNNCTVAGDNHVVSAHASSPASRRTKQKIETNRDRQYYNLEEEAEILQQGRKEQEGKPRKKVSTRYVVVLITITITNPTNYQSPPLLTLPFPRSAHPNDTSICTIPYRRT